MNALELAITPEISATSEPTLSAVTLVAQNAANQQTLRSKLPLSLRGGRKLLRISPPIDDGFRPFRVF